VVEVRISATNHWPIAWQSWNGIKKETGIVVRFALRRPLPKASVRNTFVYAAKTVAEPADALDSADQKLMIYSEKMFKIRKQTYIS
jgi:hypothetical protein